MHFMELALLCKKIDIKIEDSDSGPKNYRINPVSDCHLT